MKIRFLTIIAILAFSLSACVSLAEDITPPPSAQQPAPAETEAPATTENNTAAPAEELDGETLYLQHCAKCHNEDGTGANNKGGDLTDAARMNSYPDQMLGALIVQGNGMMMPPIGVELSDQALEALIAYVRGFSGTMPETENVDETESQAESTLDAEADGLGSVAGVVTNGTTGEAADGDFTIQMEIYDQDMMTGFVLTDILETEMNADGSFRFEEIELLEGRAFLAVLDVEGVVHTSQPAFVEEGSSELDLPLTYYETSTDASAVSVDRLHVFFEPPDTEGELAQVVEVFIVSNPTLYVIVPETEGQAVLEFALPEGAENIQFEDSVFGERYTETADGFGDTAPIFPGVGRQEVIVFFEMAYPKKFLAGNSLNFAQKIDFPVDSVIIMAPQGMKIESEILQYDGEREGQGLLYDLFSSPALPAGSTFEMQVSGKVSASATGSDPNAQQNIIYGAIALGVALIAFGLWYYFRDQNDDDDEYDDYDDEDETAYDNAEQIMDAIIALDDAYRAEEIEEEVYQKRRAELKEALKALVD